MPAGRRRGKRAVVLWYSLASSALVGGSIALVDEGRRRRNERTFGQWIDLPHGGRRYWYDLIGRGGWSARYVKEVDAREVTVRFLQEIYDDSGRLVEVHEKYPEDKGHRPV